MPIRAVVRSSLPLFSCLFCLAPSACSLEADSDAFEPAPGQTDAPIKNGIAVQAYTEAVRIDAAKNGRIVATCSGALIAPRVVLTAGRCVDSYTGWKVVAPLASGQTAAATGAITYDWTSGPLAQNPKQQDIGLIFLNRNITLKTYPRIATTKATANTKVLNIGRQSGSTASISSMYASDAVPIQDAAVLGFPYHYAAPLRIELGDIGGPALLADTTAPHTILAVASGVSENRELLARVDLVATWINKQIEAHGGR